MSANQFRDTPGRLLLSWALLLTTLLILSWRIRLNPAAYEWIEYPTALGDSSYYTALGQDDRYEPNLLFSDLKKGLYRRSSTAVVFDDASMLKVALDQSGRYHVYQRAADYGTAQTPVYLKSAENHYIEFGARKFYPPYVPQSSP